MSRTTDLEDRVLVLQDQVDTINKAFDPNQPRDQSGKWSISGAAAWLSQARVGQAAKAGDYSARAKELLAATAATIITTYNNNDHDTEAVKTAILELSTGLKITRDEAREHLAQVLNRLRAMRIKDKPDVAKAEDPVLELLTRLLKDLDELELDE